MVTTRPDPWVLRTPGACVVLACTPPGRARLTVTADDGPRPARDAAVLVRRVLLDASARGCVAAEVTLDVSSEVGGTVLAELRELVRLRPRALQVRRAGSTLLVTVVLGQLAQDAPADRRAGVRVRPPQPAAPSDLETARAAQRHLRARLRDDRNVCGVGLTRHGGRYVVRVNVLEGGAGTDVPRRVGGVPVEVRTTGRLTAA